MGDLRRGNIRKHVFKVASITRDRGIAVSLDACRDLRAAAGVGRKKLSESQRGAAVAVAGAVAGALSRTLTAPFDRIRIVSAGTGVSISSALRIIRKEGHIAAFWRGNLINCAKIIPEAGIRLSCADAFKRRVYGSNDAAISMFPRFVSGAFGGICGQAAVYPLEVIRTQIATSSPGQHGNVLQCAASLYRKQGPAAFYRGIKPSLLVGVQQARNAAAARVQLGIIPYAGLEIAFYEMLKHSWERRRGKRLHPLGVMAAGALASAGSQVLTYPIALVRTRMQAQAASVPPLTMRSCIVSVVRNDGFKGFYRGIQPNLLKMMPAAAIHWMAFDALKRNMGV